MGVAGGEGEEVPGKSSFSLESPDEKVTDVSVTIEVISFKIHSSWNGEGAVIIL